MEMDIPDDLLGNAEVVPDPGALKRVKISKGVDDENKLRLLGALMKKFVNYGKRSKMVRDTTINVLKGFGGHYENVYERHPFKIYNGQYLCEICGLSHSAKENPDHIRFAMLGDPIVHKHRVWKRGVKPHDMFGEAEAVQQYVQTYHYVFDPESVEYFQTPRRAIIDKANGVEGLDCDDLSMLACAMLGSIGYETAILITNPRGAGSAFSHAMGAVRFPKEVKGYYGSAPMKFPARKWVPMELTIRKPLGWLPHKADQFVFVKC